MVTQATTMPDDLYECLLIHWKHARQGMLEILDPVDQKSYLAKDYKPISRQSFNRCLSKKKPHERADFEKMLRTDPEQLREESMRDTEKLLQAYMNDPKVREQVNREVEEALHNATGE